LRYRHLIDLVLVDDHATALIGAARARLGHLGRERVIVGQLLAGRDVAQRDPPAPGRAGLRLPAGVDLGVGLARVIDPARLVGQIEEQLGLEVAVLVLLREVEEQRVGIVEVIVLGVEDAVAVDDDVAGLERSQGNQPIAMDG
jgi:hypothetical protein